MEVSLENLLETQLLLPGKILSALTERHRTFLVGFNRGAPDWNLLPFPDAKNLPAVRWKQINLDKMSSDKRGEVIRKLVHRYSRIIPTSRSFKCKYGYEAIRIKFAKNSEHYLIR